MCDVTGHSHWIDNDNDNDNDNEFIFQFVQVVYINTIYEYINQ